MTPHAIKARQMLANTPGRRLRIEEPQERVSPRDELRALSRVLEREKKTREEGVVEKKLSAQKSINNGSGDSNKGKNTKALTAEEFSERLGSVELRKNLPIEETPTRRSSKGSDILKSLLGSRAEARESSDESDLTPSRRPSDTVRRTSNNSIRSNDLQYRSISPRGNQSVASQFSIEVNRREESRLSWNRSRLSEVFPEFNLSQNEADISSMKSRHHKQIFESPTPAFSEQRRKDSNPFVIEVEDFEFPEVSQLPEDELHVDKVIKGSEPNDTMIESLRHDEASLSRFEENVEPPTEEPNKSINFEITDVPFPESELPITTPEINDPELNKLTTQEDHDAYSILVDENENEESLFFDDSIHSPPPVSEPSPEPEPQAFPTSLRQFSAAESLQQLHTDNSARRTLPNRIIKELTSSMSSRKIQPAGLLEIFEASERFFEQAGVDLVAYARHSKRKTIDPSDVLQLMKRQRVISESDTPYMLAKKYLPQELVDNIIEATASQT
jgi:histone H3/H4